MPNEAPTSEVPKTRGWRRYNELRRQDQCDKAAIIRGLLDGLGRPPTMDDRLAIESIAFLTIHARRLERRGKFAEAAAARNQLARERRATGLKPQPADAKPPKPTSIYDIWGDDDGDEQQ